jgi:hypothetical protein
MGGDADVIRRFPINFRPPKAPTTTVVKDTTTMTYAELGIVDTNAGNVYTADEVNAAKAEIAALDKVVSDELALIEEEAIDLVDRLNDANIAPHDYREGVEEYVQLKASPLARIEAKVNSRIDKPTLAKKVSSLKSRLNPAEVTVVLNLTQAGGRRATHKDGAQDPDPGRLHTQISKNQIVIPGAKEQSVYMVPTADSIAHIKDVGVDALRAPGGLSDEKLHWVVNALVGADADRPGTSAAWFPLLDRAAACWAHIKPNTARAWIKHAFLAKGTKLGAHYAGMYGELSEAVETIASGQLLPGTKLTMGKNKLREQVPGLKANTPKTQDVDIAYHAGSGERYYVEVKADPETIVNKIGEDEDKSKGIHREAEVLDPELRTTPDQVLSYQSTKRTHEAKATSKHYGTGAKRIIMVYSTRRTDGWLAVFTSKAARRLIKHEFHLRLGKCLMDAPAMTKMQDYVDAATKPMSKPEIEDWVKTESARPPEELLATL